MILFEHNNKNINSLFYSLIYIFLVADTFGVIKLIVSDERKNLLNSYFLKKPEIPLGHCWNRIKLSAEYEKLETNNNFCYNVQY